MGADDVDADDASSSILPTVSGVVGGSRSISTKRKGGTNDGSRTNDGKHGRTQSFSLSPPAIVYSLTTDSGDSDDDWCKGVDNLMHQDHLRDVEVWTSFEAAIEADDRKRRMDDGAAQADSSKRPKKPG